MSHTLRHLTADTLLPSGSPAVPGMAIAPDEVAGPLALPSQASSAGAARSHVRDRMATQSWSAEDLDVAVLLTSELVTNAVRHGAAPITLRLYRDAGLRVEVRDAGPPLGSVVRGARDHMAEGGHGLPLVEALASSWGSAVHDDLPAGKTVWFEMLRSATPPAESP